MTHAIVTERLTKYYGPRCVVNCLNLRVPAGTVYGLLGRNGAGKSTTIKMLMGMAQPNFGEIELLGSEIADLPPVVRERIAYLAEGHPLYGWMTVAEAVRFVRAFHPGHGTSDCWSRFSSISRSPCGRSCSRLSNGQRANVALALAVAPDPDLLVLDDPTLGLDTVARRDFLMSMIHLVQRQGRTILFSSHILADVERVADRIGIMVDGVLRVDCPTEHFKESVTKVVLEFAGSPPRFPGVRGSCGLGSRPSARARHRQFRTRSAPGDRIVSPLAGTSWGSISKMPSSTTPAGPGDRCPFLIRDDGRSTRYQRSRSRIIMKDHDRLYFVRSSGQRPSQ